VFGNIWDWLSGRLRLRRVLLGLASFGRSPLAR
jgi:hypothetical protein